MLIRLLKYEKNLVDADMFFILWDLLKIRENRAIFIAFTIGIVKCVKRWRLAFFLKHIL